MTTDWSILEAKGVEEQARRAARAIHNKFPYATEYDDLYQEALIQLATRADAFRHCLSEFGYDLGLLRSTLCRDLENMVQPEVRRKIRTVSYEEAREGHE